MKKEKKTLVLNAQLEQNIINGVNTIIGKSDIKQCIIDDIQVLYYNEYDNTILKNYDIVYYKTYLLIDIEICDTIENIIYDTETYVLENGYKDTIIEISQFDRIYMLTIYSLI